MLVILAQLAAASPAIAQPVPLPSSGEMFLAALFNNWPITMSLLAAALYMGRLTSSVQTLAASVKEMVDRVDKRLGSHSETIDDHETRLSATEAIVGVLQKKAGLR